MIQFLPSSSIICSDAKNIYKTASESYRLLRSTKSIKYNSGVAKRVNHLLGFYFFCIFYDVMKHTY